MGEQHVWIFWPYGIFGKLRYVAHLLEARPSVVGVPLGLPAVSPSLISGAWDVLKEVYGGLALDQAIDEMVPGGDPMGPCMRDQRGPAVFHSVHRFYGLLPSQPTPQRLPKMGVKERLGHGDDEGRVIVYACPDGVFAVGARIRGVHAVGRLDVVPALRGVGECFCDGHG